MDRGFERKPQTPAINEQMVGWKRDYKYYDDPVVDALIDKLNGHIKPYGKGGIALAALLKQEGVIGGYDAFLQLPAGMPNDAVEVARAIAKEITDKMSAE